MHWKHFIWIARVLPVWIVTAAVLISLFGSADKQRKARVFHDGRIEFAPNRRAFWAWPLMVAYLAWATVGQLEYSHSRPLSLVTAACLGILAVMIAFSFPETIIVTAEGLEKSSWLWKNKQIRWADIVEINTGEKSRTVTITGADGTKIVHSRQLPDRPRLLAELRDHCCENLPSDFPREPICRLLKS
jgi:hypothetical protein